MLYFIWVSALVFSFLQLFFEALSLMTLHIQFIQSLMQPHNYEFFLYCFTMFESGTKVSQKQYSIYGSHTITWNSCLRSDDDTPPPPKTWLYTSSFHTVPSTLNITLSSNFIILFSFWNIIIHNKSIFYVHNWLRIKKLQFALMHVLII
jgi:hypothetical protein